MQKVALVNSTTDILFKKPRLRDRTDRAWFSRLLRRLARESEWVYSFNPGARTGPQVKMTRINLGNVERVDSRLQSADRRPVCFPQLPTADVLVTAALQRLLHRVEQLLHQSQVRLHPDR